MPETLRHVPDEHQRQLKQFVFAVYDMADSRFIKRAQAQDHSVKSDPVENGDNRITAPDYDAEDFMAFLTTFRQLAMLQKESIYLPRIRNIIERYASDQWRDGLKVVKAQVVPQIQGRFLGMRLVRGTPEHGKSLASYQMLNALVNGRIFHRDESHGDAVTMLRESQPWHYIWIVLHEIVIPVVNACTWLVEATRADRLLDEGVFPAAI